MTPTDPLIELAEELEARAVEHDRLRADPTNTKADRSYFAGQATTYRVAAHLARSLHARSLAVLTLAEG